MPRSLKILAFWLCGLGLALAEPVRLYTPSAPGLPGNAPARSCTAAGRAAEQQGGLPANLLVSIGVVESGRMDPASGRLAAWPWTVNVDGTGHVFANEQDAAFYAAQAEEAGAHDVDVGCFQISLENHAGAFSSMDAAFDPAGNADFAAYFLNQLKTRSGSWDQAIADYHSAVPEYGLPYQRRVISAWQALGGNGAVAAAFFPDLSVILEAPAAREVRVITMDGEPAIPRRGLPQVITP